MSIAFVQGGGNHGEAGAVTFAFSGNVTANNLIVVGVGKTQDGATDAFAAGDVTQSAGTATLGTISHHVGDTWENFFSTYDKYSAVYSALVTGTGSCTLQVSAGGPGHFISAAEFSGNWDASRYVTGAAAHGASATPDTGNATSAGAALFFAVMHLAPGVSGVTITEDGAFSLVYEISGQNQQGGSGIYRLVSTGTTDSGTWTVNSSQNCSQCVAVFKEVSAATSILRQMMAHHGG